MEILYKSTRDDSKRVSASYAIAKGIADDGGLFVPEQFPSLEKSLEELSGMDYKGIAYEVMKLFFSDFSEEELKYCIDNAYDSKFDTEDTVVMSYVDKAYYLELFHGSTIAFKDMALSILPYLMKVSAKKNNIKEDIVILTATSGDTGKAALAGFAGVEGVKIIVFYPKGGVSAIQEKQMVTQVGDNVKVVGIKGNFDDAQTGVKNIFTDKEFNEKINKAGYRFSSANSINIGRLIPQVVYYVYAYANLLKNGKIEEGDLINFVVPTGNFGNILAGYFAKCIGLPVNKLICASNENKVLYDFFNSSVYDRNRDFILTTSPSMDILISSNFERLVYLSCGGNSELNKKLMNDLKEKGSYEVTAEMKQFIDESFIGGFASEKQVSDRIKNVFDKTGYVLDTHTAVASAVYEEYRKTVDDDNETVIVSTASPYKFTRAVLSAIDSTEHDEEDFVLVDRLNEISGIEIPKAVKDIRNAEILHKNVCEKADMKKEVADFLSL
ncbi:MAG: threonine synthase [Lachnospiraceae bacterium]|nr:threonine synthase [Lachnospiraceae bacterium]